MKPQAGPEPTGVRLDIWLDVACLFRTRSEAQRAVNGGKVEINGQNARPHRLVHPGDELRITRPAGRKQVIAVKGLAEKHVPKTEAKLLYEDRTPPPTPEELAAKELERFYWAARPRTPVRKPDRRERRHLRSVKQGDGSQ